MPTRREIFPRIGAALFLSACGQSIIFQREPQRVPENFNRSPEKGDAVSYRGIPCLMRANVGMKIPDLPLYLKYSKAAEYGRKFWDNLPNYVLEDIIDRFPPQSINVINFFSEFTGLERIRKPNGGEGLVFWPGALTYGGSLISRKNDPFVHIRNKLADSKWRLEDCDFFTYGAVPFVDYTRLATIGSVDKNIQNALAFVNSLKILEPFEQQNHIAHSAGGIYAFEAVMRNMDLVNNLILVGVPIRGLRGTSGKIGDTITKLGWDDNLVSYLTGLSNDKDYQKRIDRLGEEFTRKGRKLTVIIHEDDPIATEENAMIKGADLIVLKGGIALGDSNPLQGWEAHGAGLSNSLTLEAIESKIGMNLAPII